MLKEEKKKKLEEREKEIPQLCFCDRQTKKKEERKMKQILVSAFPVSGGRTL